MAAARNFYITADIDGRSSQLSGGPRSKDGGMLITLKHRQDGMICKAAEISCIARADGTLIIEIKTPGNETIEIESAR